MKENILIYVKFSKTVLTLLGETGLQIPARIFFTFIYETYKLLTKKQREIKAPSVSKTINENFVCKL